MDLEEGKNEEGASDAESEEESEENDEKGSEGDNEEEEEEVTIPKDQTDESEDKQLNTEASIRFQCAAKKLTKCDTLDKVDLQPMSKRILYPRKSSSTVQRVPILGGSPITEDIAIKLRKITFGTCDLVGTCATEWVNCSFWFNESSSQLTWALRVDKDETKGLIMCVQGYVLKHLLFSRRRNRGTSDVNQVMNPDLKTQEECLAGALSDILWKAGEKQGVTICLKQDKEHVENSESYFGDGVTEKLHMFHFKKQDELTFNIKKYLFQFFSDEESSGIIQFLYSVLLTRGFERLKEDMDDGESSAIMPNGQINPCTALLLLSGRATPYLHNGIIYEGTEATMATPKTGILLRSEIGYMQRSSKDKNKKNLVGSRLKTPSLPIWISNCDGNFGLLFNPKRDLMRDYHAENRFELLYFSGHLDHREAVKLSINTREQCDVDSFSSPPLDLLIQTKWQDASIRWNGVTPFV